MKKLTIDIHQDDLQILRKSGYHLCLAARPADDDYDVIWMESPHYSATNQVKIDYRYQIFASKSFVAGKKVLVSTRAVDIRRGQTCRLDRYGYLYEAVDSGSGSVLTMNNDFGLVHVGYCMAGVDIEGKEIMNPAYITPMANIKGCCEINPTDEIMVWFEQNAEVGKQMIPRHEEMFRGSRSKSMIVDFTDWNSISVRYEDGSWTMDNFCE